ncbi:MAG TPA: hypothetical protein PLB45_00570 [Bacilli bacterium]|jgi:hypothetical protein|nr:hypothetical protein [Bacilli bacterium]HPZ23695.1 hypothetical protein [Bacilli bacterium]HQC83353.1 hypothetical protein [Bacilli bacterium]
MINENTKLNIILGIICACILLAVIYMVNYRNNLEEANIYFKIKDIQNINWVNETSNMKFYTDGKTLTFKIGDKVIVDDKSFSLNQQTGEIIIDPKGDNIEGSLYLRSVSSNNIVIWYEEAEYRLEKEVILQ